jgi:Holliday junction DNA helicase RuvB
VRDFADVIGDGRIGRDIADTSLTRLDIDATGLDRMDRRILEVMIKQFSGGPVGIDSLSAAIGEDKDTIEDVYEPFLIQNGYINRTPRGRQAAGKAYKHLGISRPRQMDVFNDE